MMARTRNQRNAPRAPLWARNNTNLHGQIDLAIGVIALAGLAATMLVGTLAAAAFIAAALALLARNPATASRDLLRCAPLLLIPLLAMVSTIWSDAPQRTLRAGIQLLLTFVAAILVCRKMEPRQVILTLFLAFLVVSLSALPFLPHDLGRGHALQGLFQSKNQLGACLHLVFALGLAVMCDRGQPTWARLSTIVVIPLCIAMLWLTQSATAQTSTGVTLLVFPILLLFGRIPISGRLALALVAVAVIGVALVFLPVILDAIADFRQNVLKKDATLTGRTYLWEYAARLTAERPLLGHGYFAFWRQGNLDAEGLWRWGGMASGSGFNFHNAFVEIKVDLGYIGQGLLIATCVAFSAIALYRQLVSPSVSSAFFLALQVVLYARSFAETGLIAPFSLLSVLWIASGLYALRSGDAASVPKPKPTLPKRRRYSRDPVRA